MRRILILGLSLGWVALGCKKDDDRTQSPSTDVGPVCTPDDPAACADCDECGDGIVSGDEECDDGNTDDGDGCAADCHLEVCGNGIVDPGEECDGDDTAGEFACRDDCTYAYCGNGKLDDGEECDEGEDTATCVDCRYVVCGDGYVQGNEECDDGNTDGGDGCSATCTTESCPSPGDLCTPGATDVAACDDPCVASVCADNPTCCEGTWDDACVALYAESCGVECDVCGNGTCGAGETCHSCPEDCGAC